MFEIYIWIVSLMGVSASFILLAMRWHVGDIERCVYPLATVKFEARLAITNAIAYAIFAALAIHLTVKYEEFLPEALKILQDWFVLELFILWNARTMALIILGLKKIKVYG